MLITTTALASALAGAGWTERADAQSSGPCGSQIGGAVTCSPSGNRYRTGIAYSAQPATPGEDVTDPATDVLDLAVSIESGVSIVLPPRAGAIPAVRAQGHQDADVSILAAPGSSISTAGRNQTGISGTVQDGTLRIEASNIRTDQANSIAILGTSTGTGDIDLNASGVTTSARGSHGVAALSSGTGTIAIKADDIVTGGPNAHGVQAATENGAVQIVAGRITTTGNRSDAISATGGGDVRIELAGPVTTSGRRANGVFVTADGNIEVFGEGSIVTDGRAGSGVDVFSTAGHVAVDLPSITAGGRGAWAVYAGADAGNVDLTIGSATASGANATGVQAMAKGDVRAVLGSLVTSGAGSQLASLEARGALDVVIDDGTGTGIDGTGIRLTGQSVAATVTGAISVQNGGSDGAALEITAAPFGPPVRLAAAGAAAAIPGGATLDNRGRIEASGTGIAAVVIDAQSDLVVTGDGSIETGDGGRSALIFSSGGNATISQGLLRASGDNASGVTGTAEGDVTIAIGRIETSGQVGHGVSLRREGSGATRVDVGALAISGLGTTGVHIDATGTTGSTGPIQVNVGRMDVATADGWGIYIDAANADVSASIGSADLPGATPTAVYAAGRSTDLTVGSVMSGADSSFSLALVDGVAYDGEARVIVTDRVEARGALVNGVRAVGDSVLVAGGGTVVADGGSGVVVESRGAARIDLGTVAAGGLGGHAVDIAAADGVTAALGSVRATGYDAKGVRIVAQGGDVAVAVGGVVTTGERGTGVRIENQGSGATSLVMDQASTSGIFANAASVIAGVGPVDVTLKNVLVSGDYSSGVAVSAPQAALTMNVSDMTVIGSSPRAVDVVVRSVDLTTNGSIRTALGGTPAPGEVAMGLLLKGTEFITLRNHGDLAISGSASALINARSNGDISIVSDGTMLAQGLGAFGITAQTLGNVTVDLRYMRVLGDFTAGVGALAGGDVSIKVDRYEATGSNLGLDSLALGNITAQIGSADTQDNLVAFRASGLATFRNTGTIVQNGTGLMRIFAGDIDVTFDGDILTDAGDLSTLLLGAAKIALTTNEPRYRKDDSRLDIRVTNNALVRVDQFGFDAMALFSGHDIDIAGNGRIESLADVGGGLRLQAANAIRVTQESISTRGLGADAISADASGDFTASVNRIGTDGNYSTGISGDITGAAAIHVNDLSIKGRGAKGMFLFVGGDTNITLGMLGVEGDESTGLSVQKAGSITARLGAGSLQGDAATFAQLRAAGDIALAVDGPLTIAGLGSVAVDAQSDRAIAIDLGAVDISGANSRALRLTAGSDVTVRIADGLASAAPHDEVQTATVTLVGGAAATLVNEGTITATGARNAALSITSAELATLDGNGSVATGGDDATAIGIAGQQGVTVRGSAIATAGARSQGLSLVSGGDALIDLAIVTTSGASSTAAKLETQGEAMVRVGSIVTNGAQSDGLMLRAGGSADIVLGSVSVGQGASAALVASAGDARVLLGNLAVADAGSRGIDALADGSGEITIVGAVVGSADQQARSQPSALPGGREDDSAQAIVSLETGGFATVVNNGSIATSGILEGGIAARGATGSLVTSAGPVVTSGAGATGIYAAAYANSARADVASVVTGGDDARGVLVRSLGDSIAVVRSVSTGGDRADGVTAEGAGSAEVRAGQVTTSGAQAYGVRAQSFGSVLVSADDVAVSGSGATGIEAASFERGNATVVAGGRVSVTGGSGIDAYAADGRASVRAAEVRHSGAGYGVLASGSSGATIEFGSVVSTGSYSGEAVTAFAASGVTTIKGDTVTATGDRRDAVAAVNDTGNLAIAVNTVSASGADSVGIYAGGAGSVTIVAREVVNDAGEVGAILAEGGNIAITAGSVTASGTPTGPGPGGSAAVSARAVGDALVSVGRVSATGGHDGIRAEGGNKAGVSVAVDGSVLSSRDAVVLAAAAANSLTNDGALQGTVAVRASGGAATIANNGTISGALILTDNADRVINRGQMELMGATAFGAGDDVLENGGALRLVGPVEFGTGTDRLVNRGTIAFGSLNAARIAPTSGSRAISGVEATANSGLIELRNGMSGDVLTLSGTYAGSGNSTLGLDVAYGASITADRLEVGGATTGATRIVLQTTGNAAVLDAGTTVVQAGAGSVAGAFTLDPSQVSVGMFQRAVVFNAPTNSYRLVSGPSAAAYRLLKVSEGARSLALDSADTVTSHFALARDGKAPGSGLWSAMGGGLVSRDEQRSLSSFGLSQTADLGYRQDGFSGQLGADMVRGRAAFGVTGGYAHSILGFDRSADRVEYDAYNVGAYAALRSGPLFVNVLVKYDRYDLKVDIAGQSAKTDGEGLTGRGEAGLRFGSDRFFVEPAARISWSEVSLDALALPATISFDDRAGWTGAAGLRLGALRDVGGARVTVYGAGDYVRAFRADQGIAFATGSVLLAVGDTRLPSHVTGKVGVSVERDQVSGFVEGVGRFSGSYNGGGARAGLRLRF
ncbi:hypothetical protein [Sphingomonas jatrophae]|uniref:hypothetical protein n=1 Tax=Sphingomonas jatrophae TaxID=1166337 RepID=UPI0013F4D4C2|nr:hypothetical protein [Sphingomonas jatrophae]